MSQLVWPSGSATKEPARSDGYGPRGRIPGVNTRPFHVGQDWYGIGVLRSIGAGTVVEVGWGGWAGNQILIDLGVIGGVRTWVRYCHLAHPSPMKRGQRVDRGQWIGNEGTTGDSTGVHLHLEIYRGRVDRGSGANPGATVDPRAFIKKYLFKPGGTKVKHYVTQDPSARGGGRTLGPGGQLYLSKVAGVSNSKATNVVGGIGSYSITPHVYAEGEPGDAVLLTLMWQNTKSNPRRNSNHYVERLVFDKDGQLQASREFKRAVASGYAVYVKINTPKSNVKPVKITLLDCDAYLYV